MKIFRRILEYLRMHPILPYSRFTKSKIEDLENKLIKVTENYNELQESYKKNIANLNNEATELREAIIENKNDFSNECIKLNDIQQGNIYKLEKHQRNIHAISRELMKVKWKQIDRITSETESADDIIQCGICEYEAERKSFDIKETECIFNGGKLIRYICPSCGAIFGPTKFSTLTQQEKDEDYYIHYLGFEESDSTDKEIRAFYMLEPRKEGIYLNYGCGSWSDSLKQLSEEGYTVYGYEPYAESELDNPMLISTIDNLKRFRFDGIFSNDLLEHLIDPVSDLKFMKTLLRDGNSKMAHSTSCYIYKHEITRFHTYFFTGNAVNVLCERAGLNICDYENDVDKNDFICYVFQNSDSESDYMPLMCINENGVRQDDGRIILNEKGILYGPYLTYSKGIIKIYIDITIEDSKEICTQLTSNSGKKFLGEIQLKNGLNEIEYEFEDIEKDFEIVIRASEEIVINKVCQILS